MKKTTITKTIVFVLVSMVLAGEAIGQPGGGRGRGVRPGWGRGMAGRPQMDTDPDSPQPDNSWVPGPYCPWAQGPNQNIQPRQDRGPGGFGQYFQRPRGPYCPFGQGPYQNIRGRQGTGPRGFGQGLQGRGIGPAGRGFRRQDMITQRGPMAGRGGRGFQRRNIARQGWGMNNWRGQFRPEGIGRPGRGTQPRRFASEDKGQWMPPRARGWTPGWGQDWTPDWNLKPQPEKAPDANAPEAPTVEDQPEQPQGE